MMSISRSTSRRQLGMWTRIAVLGAGKHGEAETLENAADFERAQFLAENAAHFAEVKFHGCEVELASDDVDHVADERAASGREDEFGDAVGGGDGRFEIGSALEAVRGVGVDAVALRHAAHGDWVPPRGFDQHVLRLLGDHRVEAAHHSGEADRLYCVGYDQVLGSEFAIDSIERLERLAGSCFANDQATAFEQIEIENVGWLAALPENIVGGIDRIADGPLIDERKTIARCAQARA